MTGAPLELAECPAFGSLRRAAIAYAFEIDPGGAQDDTDGAAFRVSNLHNALFGTRPLLSGNHLKRAEALFEGSRTFLDDITTGIPGVNGRPLLLAASLQGEDDPARRCTIRRPAKWSYKYESTTVGLSIAQNRRDLPAILQDHFCVFESGRIFYILALTHPSGQPSSFDEYSLIHMLQLVRKAEEAGNAKYLAFSHGAKRLSLIEFAEARLKAIDCRGSGKDRGFALGDVLRPFGILPENPAGGLGNFTLGAPYNALVQIEDTEMFEVARHTLGHYRIDHQALETGSAAARAKQPAWLEERHAQWAARGCEAQDIGGKLHDAAGIGEEDITDIPRHILAFAGLVQRVPDFPRQDDSEIHDSTRPVSVALENLFYVHPAFECIVGINWRTFKQGQADIGACPYALMTWLIVVHDEILVTEMENLIQDMLYTPPGPRDPIGMLGRTVPADGLGKLLRRVANPIPAKDCSLDDNLRHRLTIFRRCTIHQSGNVFRYPTERGVLDDVREARGTRARFDAALALIDRYENLAEDVANLKAAYTSSRATMLLALLSILGALSLPSTIIALAKLLHHPITAQTAILGTLAVIIGAMAGLWGLQLSRSRNSS